MHAVTQALIIIYEYRYYMHVDLSQFKGWIYVLYPFNLNVGY